MRLTGVRTDFEWPDAIGLVSEESEDLAETLAGKAKA
jgi:hypothetical protein